MQDLTGEVAQLKQEFSVGLGELNRKLDLVILVHNLAQEIPGLHHAHVNSHIRPSLSVFMDEARAAGIPSILAMTNKFSVSADKQISVANAVMEAYQVSPNMGVLINSCPHALHGMGSMSCAWNSSETTLAKTTRTKSIKGAAQKLISAPINLVQLRFRKKEDFLPIEGVDKLHKLVKKVLMSYEESALQELARDRLLIATAKEQMQAADALSRPHGKLNSSVSALVGASLGAGLGIVMAVIMGAASSFRRPSD